MVAYRFGTPAPLLALCLVQCVEAHPAWVGSTSGEGTSEATTGDSGTASATSGAADTGSSSTSGSSTSSTTTTDSGPGTSSTGGGSTGAPCEPAPEACNGVDDDCDGLIDEVADGLVSCGPCTLEQREDHAYWFCDDPSTWQLARMACLDLGADLVSVRDEAEALYLADHLPGQGGSFATNAWMGLNDLEIEDTFVWADGEPFSYAYWEPSEPNDVMGNEDCVEIRDNKAGQWNDAVCDAAQAYICWAPHTL